MSLLLFLLCALAGDEGIAVTVRDLSGTPISGATVVLAGDARPEGWWRTSDESGRALFEDAPAWIGWFLGAAAPGYAPEYADLGEVRGERGGAIDLCLTPEFRAAGVVVDEAGAPLAGARIVPQRSAGGEWRRRGYAERRLGALTALGRDNPFAVETATDAAGRFELGSLLAREPVELCLYRGDGSAAQCFRIDAALPGGRSDDVELVLGRRITVRCRVTCAGGAPPADATVNGKALREGRIELPWTSTFSGSVVASAPGFRTVLRLLQPPLPDVVDLEIDLTRGRELAVRVTDPAGRPISGAPVRELFARRLPDEGASWLLGSAQRGRSDGDGWCRLSGLPDHVEGIAVDGPDGDLAFDPAVVAVPDGAGAVEVVLVERGSRSASRAAADARVPGSVSGRVVAAATGEPVLGAEVRALRLDLLEAADTADHAAVRGEHFALRGLSPGSYRIAVRAAGRALAYSGVVAVPAGGAAEDLEIPVSVGAAAAVRLIPTESAPLPRLAGARVRLSLLGGVDGVPAAFRSVEAVADGSGIARFAGLSQGSYGVTLSDTGAAAGMGARLIVEGLGPAFAEVECEAGGVVILQRLPFCLRVPDLAFAIVAESGEVVARGGLGNAQMQDFALAPGRYAVRADAAVEDWRAWSLTVSAGSEILLHL